MGCQRSAAVPTPGASTALCTAAALASGFQFHADVVVVQAGGVVVEGLPVGHVAVVVVPTPPSSLGLLFVFLLS